MSIATSFLDTLDDLFRDPVCWFGFLGLTCFVALAFGQRIEIRQLKAQLKAERRGK